MTLGYAERALVQALTAHVLASSLAALVVSQIWRRVAALPAPAGVVAGRLFLLRLAPAMAGGLAVLLVVAAYARWETHVEVERVGGFALASAAAGLLLILLGGWRAAAAARRTRIIRRTLSRASAGRLAALPMQAHIVDSRFPVVALVGLVMTRLFVARRVIDSCTAGEFGAVIAHEQAHARTRDNLRRLAMTASPDALSLVSAGDEIQRAWLRAAEHAADEWAAAATDGVLLASALVKVARLATTAGPEPLLSSALYRGEPIAERVHRLLEPAVTPPPHRLPRWLRVAACLAAASAAVLGLPAAHAAAEQILKWGL